MKFLDDIYRELSVENKYDFPVGRDKHFVTDRIFYFSRATFLFDFLF